MTRILIGWELGGGRGHMGPIAELVRELNAPGVTFILAPQNVAALSSHNFGEAKIAVVQAPVWPGLLRSMPQRNEPTVTFGDILANLGLADPMAVEGMLRAWDYLLASLSPDLVIADYAPMLLLAARGRVRRVAIGNGFSLPPADLPAFPSLQGNRSAWIDEGALLEALNRALRRIGRQPLEALPALMTADNTCVYGFASLDPYHGHRREPNARAAIGGTFTPSNRSGDEIFVYLAATFRRESALIPALRRFGAKVRAYLPGLSTSEARDLVADGVRLETRPRSLSEIERQSRLVVTNGNGGISSAALAMGLPNLAWPFDLEKVLTSEALVRLRAGVRLDRSLTVEQIEGLIRSVYEDDDGFRKMGEIGRRHHAEWTSSQPMATRLQTMIQTRLQ